MLVPLGSSFLAEVEATLGGWSWAGFVDQAPAPNTWFVHEAAGRSLLIARDGAGALGAFVNACTHRGTRLCAGPGAGKLRCAYHGWVFACDGRLLGATRRAGLAPADDADLALHRWGCATLGPLVFVHPDPDAPSLTADLEARLGPAGAADLARLSIGAEGATRVDVLVPRPWDDVRAALEAATLPGLGPEAGRTWAAPNLLATVDGPHQWVVAAVPWTQAETRLRGRVRGACAAKAAQTLAVVCGKRPPPGP